MSSQKRKYELKARADAQRDTRRRIVEATAELHQEVGPARTSVSEIARRAGVNRATIYNHFPEDAELFAACQGHFLAQHPLPDLTAVLAVEDPRARTSELLRLLYSSYREREQMTEKVLRDRAALPALDELMAQTLDAPQAHLLDALARGFKVRGAAARRTRAVLALALDFWTWQRLSREGLGDDAAADLITQLVATAAEPRA